MEGASGPAGFASATLGLCVMQNFTGLPVTFVTHYYKYGTGALRMEVKH